MTGLIGFLRARLDDDERFARQAIHNARGALVEDDGTFRVTWADAHEERTWVVSEEVPGHWVQPASENIPSHLTHIVRHDPARVLRDVEAKRRIVAEAENYVPELEHGDNGEWAFDRTLRLLAVPYVDHSDYREEWTP